MVTLFEITTDDDDDENHEKFLSFSPMEQQCSVIQLLLENILQKQKNKNYWEKEMTCILFNIEQRKSCS